mgnify:CR=1 FL=1
MGDATEQTKDVGMCYKALGLSFSDPPPQVEKMYLKIKGDGTKAMRSEDPAVRKNATEKLQLLEEMYATITNSLVYRDYAKQYEKRKQIEEEERQAQKQKKQEEQSSLVICPNCGKMIPASLEVCVYCNKKTKSIIDKLRFW